MTDTKPVLVSGIKPTGDLHIGNYFGAMRQFVELIQTGKYRPFIFVADYHALNTMQDAEEMRRRTHELVMGCIAAGLDPKEVVFFKQSDVPAHTELCWIFDTITTMPYLMRAHAFKDAEAKNKEINVGTFNYPMLMAADILLYDAAVVPVGADQKQHIEIARDTAEKFNRVFKTNIFKLPRTLHHSRCRHRPRHRRPENEQELRERHPALRQPRRAREMRHGHRDRLFRRAAGKCLRDSHTREKREGARKDV